MSTAPGRTPRPPPPIVPRTPSEKYFARVARDDTLPTRNHKILGVGGWILGGVLFGYMALYADFGEHEHCFSPIRRQYRRFTGSLFSLSPSERAMMGIEASRIPASESIHDKKPS